MCLSQRDVLNLKSAKLGCTLRKRPLLGWGFNGHSIFNAAHYLCPSQSELIVLEDYTAYCQMASDEIVSVATTATKAHNLFLDIQISLGIIGSINYTILLSCYVLSPRQNNTTLMALVIAYLIYLLTWYDSGQLTHIGWWVLSIQTVNWNDKSIGSWLNLKRQASL